MTIKYSWMNEYGLKWFEESVEIDNIYQAYDYAADYYDRTVMDAAALQASWPSYKGDLFPHAVTVPDNKEVSNMFNHVLAWSSGDL